MMIISERLIKAPKNKGKLPWICRKYYNGVIRLTIIYNSVIGFLFDKNVKPSGIRELDDICLRSRHKSDISDHLVHLFQESLAVQPKLIVELGIGPGESSYVLERVAGLSGARLVSVDIDPKVSTGIAGNRFVVKADDVEFSKEFKSWCQRNDIVPSIDVLFIDTSHKYKHTLSEINCWFPFLSTRAKVFFHDTNIHPIYWRRDCSVGITYAHEPRGVISAIESYLGAKFEEKKDFSCQAGDWSVRHDHHCNGFTILEKVNNPR